MTATNTGPIFVVGSMRSGSTLLRLILDSHPHIAIPHETGFMAALRGTKDIPNWKFGKGWYERLNWTEQEIDERLREFYSGLFERFAAQQGKQRWGEKTPFHTAHITEMAQVFPDAVFVAIIRHPGAVAASLRKNFHYTFPDAVSYWSATNADLTRSGSVLGRRFAALRYEDLVDDSEPVLRDLMTFLDEPWSPNLLRHQEVQRDQGAPRIAEGSTVTRDAIDSQRVAHWTRDARTEDYQALESAAELSRFFGYDPLDASDRQPLLATGGELAWAATGEDLTVRRRHWVGRVEFAVPPATPLPIDASPEELAARLFRAESALQRVRSRRSVRVADALRKVQRGRSLGAFREAWSMLRGPGVGRER